MGAAQIRQNVAVAALNEGLNGVKKGHASRFMWSCASLAPRKQHDECSDSG
ncbi:hypothetical protein HALO59_30031 [Halomonas sp. 59]|nr:hypothetical protein HALOI3_10366 [Halomonas sp. I3]CAD5273196.1 hypothetical protein HALO59_30031 [Halomonas sp. 59]VXB83245.1 hypothetical protein HALO98_30057 [Halomonas titanicae]